jgi:ABC-type multidrug transport system fused ATPase/permease subunit
MKLVRLYLRVLGALHREARLAWILAVGNRLATIRKADNILMFENGRIVESGTFDELVARNGPFAELARAQYLAPEAAAAE